MRSEPEVRQALRDWLVKVSSKEKKSLPSLTDQTLLLQGGVISSLRLMDLVHLIEDLRGEPVDVSGLAPGSFASIDAIYQHFFARDPA